MKRRSTLRKMRWVCPWGTLLLFYLFAGPPMAQAIALSFDCTESEETGYISGNSFPITVITVQSKQCELETANAYYVMAEAALEDGVSLNLSSCFRSNEKQTELYNCYLNCNCNDCNLAALPGYSNHQAGTAVDISTGCLKNTSNSACEAISPEFTWLQQNGNYFGFFRTVQSEPWHWVHQGGGPGGGMCGLTCETACMESTGGVSPGYFSPECSENLCAVGTSCATVNGGPSCVDLLCVYQAGMVEPGVEFCVDSGTIGKCSENGLYTETESCGTGLKCNDCISCGVPEETLCDGVDEDCDGLTDESFPIGEPCWLPECNLKGALVCSASGLSATCSIGDTCPPSPDPESEEDAKGDETPDAEEGMNPDAGEDTEGWSVDFSPPSDSSQEDGSTKSPFEILIANEDGNPSAFNPNAFDPDAFDPNPLEGEKGGGCSLATHNAPKNYGMFVTLLMLLTLGLRLRKRGKGTLVTHSTASL